MGLSFEQALKRLEEIINRLEDGGEELQTTLALFEEGTKLVETCQQYLGQAQQQITSLSEKLEEGQRGENG